MVKLFADDTKLYSVVNYQQEAEKLQTDLDNICMWSEKWQLNFNIGKCKHMRIVKINENEQREYYMTKNNQRQSIITIQEEKDLGVTIDNQMKFVSHIQASVKKRHTGI